MNRRTADRIKNHSLIIGLSAGLLFLFYAAVPGDDKKYLWSMATAYTSVVLLGITLIIGPINILKRRNNPTSSDLRRDFGIWSAFVGIAHVIVGIQVHMGNIWLYFFKSVKDNDAFKLRSDLFGAANYTGLGAALILVVLLLLSNDISLQVLKPVKWKRLQQLSYLLFALTLAHGIMYQVIEKRMRVLITVFAVTMTVPLLIQLRGVIARRKIKS
jgi:sulfoxide reductase heme-binding subunit YedZ